MISMSMNNFYSWQTYADGKEVNPLGFRESFEEAKLDAKILLRRIFQSKACMCLHGVLGPVFDNIEQYTGVGGNMTAGYSKKEKEERDQAPVYSQRGYSKHELLNQDSDSDDEKPGASSKPKYFD